MEGSEETRRRREEEGGGEGEEEEEVEEVHIFCSKSGGRGGRGEGGGGLLFEVGDLAFKSLRNDEVVWKAGLELHRRVRGMGGGFRGLRGG